MVWFVGQCVLGYRTKVLTDHEKSYYVQLPEVPESASAQAIGGGGESA